jgi:hypothetical protein
MRAAVVAALCRSVVLFVVSLYCYNHLKFAVALNAALLLRDPAPTGIETSWINGLSALPGVNISATVDVPQHLTLLPARLPAFVTQEASRIEICGSQLFRSPRPLVTWDLSAYTPAVCEANSVVLAAGFCSR